MTADTTTLPRKFFWLTTEFADPDPGLNVVDVRNQLATMLPDLTNASISEPVVKNGFQEYTFKKATGTKG